MRNDLVIRDLIEEDRHDYIIVRLTDSRPRGTTIQYHSSGLYIYILSTTYVTNTNSRPSEILTIASVDNCHYQIAEHL